MEAKALPAFKLERYFARWEFCAPHLLCCSDVEPLHLRELLELADADSRSRWENLRLGYGETRGMPELLQEVAGLYDAVQPKDVLVAAPQECVYLAMRALLRPGDHVVVTYPGYQSLYEIARCLGCEVDMWEVELGEDGSAAFDVDKFKALLRPGATRLAVVNFPHNPTGWLPGAAQWGELVGACRGAGCYLFSDEMYRFLELDPAARLPAAADVYERGISLAGMSKAFGLPGLRIGWLACRCPEALARAAELKDYTTICSAGPSEVLALMALRAREALLARSRRIITTNLAALAAFMATWRHVFRYTPPAAGSVAFPRLAACADSHDTAATPHAPPPPSPDHAAPPAAATPPQLPHIEAWCDALVRQSGVLLLPASVYDHGPSAAAGHFRIGLGRADLPACLEALGAHLRGREGGGGGGGGEDSGGSGV